MWAARRRLPVSADILAPVSMAPTRRLELTDRSRDRRPPVERGLGGASPCQPRMKYATLVAAVTFLLRKMVILPDAELATAAWM